MSAVSAVGAGTARSAAEGVSVEFNGSEALSKVAWLRSRIQALGHCSL